MYRLWWKPIRKDGIEVVEVVRGGDGGGGEEGKGGGGNWGLGGENKTKWCFLGEGDSIRDTMRGENIRIAGENKTEK